MGVIKRLFGANSVNFLGAFAVAATCLLIGQMPDIDVATSRAYNPQFPIAPNLRETAQNSSKDVITRIGLAHGVPAGSGPVEQDLIDATSDAILVRAMTCAADLVVVAQAENDYQSAFSEDGSTIFTVRLFRVGQVLRRSSVTPGELTSYISVSRLGGTVTVNGHEISVQQPNVAGFRTGVNYLLFLKAIPGGAAFQAFPQSSYDLTNAHLASTAVGHRLDISEQETQREIGIAATHCPEGAATGVLEY